MKSKAGSDRARSDHHGNVDLRNSLPAVLEAWNDLSEEDPWHLSPDRFGVDALEEVLRAVLDVASSDAAAHDVHERLVRAASHHGSQRRSQDAPDDAVLREYHALREALWRFLARQGIPASAALPIIVRVDAAISVATTAALRGYHRAEISADEWDAQLLRDINAASAQFARGLDRTTGGDRRLTGEGRRTSQEGSASGDGAGRRAPRSENAAE